MFVVLRSKCLPLLALVPLMAGCSTWPNFEYAPVVVLEDVNLDNDQAQHLGVLYPLVSVLGNIETTGVEPSTAYSAFGYDEWYSGEEDFYAFNMPDTNALALTLQWTSSTTDLDLYLFEYDNETGRLDSLKGDSLTESTLSPEQVVVPGLNPGVTYVILVAGSSGPATPYELLIDIQPLGTTS